jgi:hypothetical protein
VKQLIDITMTAVIRPEVIRQTLESFCNDLFYDDKINYRLIINIDPIGEDKSPMEVVKVAESFFDNVVYNIPKEPSFCKAVIWVWNKIVSDYVFHLEDDWVILRKIPLVEMIRILDKNPDLSCLHFYRKDISNRKKISLFGTTYVYKNNYYVSGKPFGFSLNPVLVRSEFIKQVVSKMNNKSNPEKQIRVRNDNMKEILSSWKYGIYGQPNQTKTVYGKNGLHWREEMGFRKPDNHFNTWVRRDDGKHN